MANTAGRRSEAVVLFLLTDFNSVDHMAPVAYKLARTGKGIPVLLVSNPLYDIAGDYRLDFLRTEYGLEAERLFATHQDNSLVRWLARRFCHPIPRTGVRRAVYPRVMTQVSRLFYRRTWARRLLDKYSPSALLFERENPRRGLVGALVHEGRRRGIRSYSLPHGLFCYTNELTNETDVEAGALPKSYYRNFFDYAVYQSDLHARVSVKEGLYPEKAVVLGSTRYCEEWASINQCIQPVAEFVPSGDASDRLKVVFMLTQWNYNVHRNATIDTLGRLSKMDSIYLAVKPHPRQGIADLAHFLRDRLPDNVEVSWDIPSPSLIKWCDTVLNIGSSIALEALLQKKTLLQLNYLHSNRTVFQDEGACWNLDSDEELEAALVHLAGGGDVPYGEEEVDRVMRQLVRGGSDDTDVLARYVDFILDSGHDKTSDQELTTTAQSHELT